MVDGVAFVDGKYVPADEARMAVFDLGFRAAMRSTTRRPCGRAASSASTTTSRGSCARPRAPGSHARIDPAQLKRILADLRPARRLRGFLRPDDHDARHYRRSTNRDPRLCENRFMAYALPYIWIISPEKQEIGINLAIVDNRRTPTEAIDPRIKNFNWMDLQRGLFEALDRGADIAVLCTPAGQLAEGPGFNLFLVKDKQAVDAQEQHARGHHAPERVRAGAGARRALRCRRPAAGGAARRPTRRSSRRPRAASCRSPRSTGGRSAMARPAC